MAGEALVLVYVRANGRRVRVVQHGAGCQGIRLCVPSTVDAS